MNDLKQALLGGYAAVRITNEKEFEQVIEFLAIKNCFLANKEPVTKMSYPGGDLFVLYRADDGFIWWSPVADIDMNKYQLIDVKQLDLEKVDDQTILEANATIIEEVKELTEENMTLVVMAKPNNDAIPSNVDDLLKLIPAIKSKANIVVTEDNYKSFVAKGSGLVPTLRKYAKGIKDEKKKLKDSYMSAFEDFSKKTDMVIDALETTAKEINDNVNVYVEKKKDADRKEKTAKIEELKKVLIEKGMLSKEFADRFAFDERWLNVSCSNKKFMEEVDKQFQELIEQQNIEKQNAAMVESTIVNTCNLTGIDEKLVKRDKYLILLKAGQSLAEITKMITDDINALKQQKEAMVEAQKREEAVREERFKKQQEEAEKRHQEELKQVSGNNLAAANATVFVDEKTGEVYAKANDKAITIAIQEAPAKVREDKIFAYTYRFEGNFKAILTFNKCLKALSKVFKSFKYMEVK